MPVSPALPHHHHDSPLLTREEVLVRSSGGELLAIPYLQGARPSPSMALVCEALFDYKEAVPIDRFPNIEDADESGLLAIGGDLSVPSLRLAYESGIFPWPILDDNTLAWFAPPERAVLLLNQFHISRSLSRERKNSSFTFSINSSFDAVIEACASATNRFDSHGRRQRGTWIHPPMVSAYKAMHRAGYAHSVECWNGKDLVGGLYGVSIGGMFAGESMFYTAPNASKLALCFLVDFLQDHSVPWIDCQVMTPLFASFGAKEIPRNEFMKLLAQALRYPSPFSTRRGA